MRTMTGTLEELVCPLTSNSQGSGTQAHLLLRQQPHTPAYWKIPKWDALAGSSLNTGLWQCSFKIWQVHPKSLLILSQLLLNVHLLPNLWRVLTSLLILWLLFVEWWREACGVLSLFKTALLSFTISSLFRNRCRSCINDRSYYHQGKICDTLKKEQIWWLTFPLVLGLFTGENYSDSLPKQDGVFCPLICIL